MIPAEHCLQLPSQLDPQSVSSLTLKGSDALGSEAHALPGPARARRGRPQPWHETGNALRLPWTGAHPFATQLVAGRNRESPRSACKPSPQGPSS
jgi:hypothetical protein